MSPRLRVGLFLAAAVAVAVWFARACFALPSFGTARHPYGERAVVAALRHHTANVVSSVNFDLRAIDTLGEESLMFAAVLGAVVLLRRARDERRTGPRPAKVLPPVLLFGALLLPLALVTGAYVVVHGGLSPGGGFQGGVVLATALHLGYVAADYAVLERLRPLAVLDVTDAIGAGAFTVLGVAGLLSGAAFLANVAPFGTFNTLTSGGLVPLLSVAVGVEVGSGVIVLLAQFLDQALEVQSRGDR